MIDVSTITDVKALLEMKNELNFFINKKIVAEIYEEQDKDKFELEVDRQAARELLTKVLNRIIRLNPPAKKRGSKHHPVDTSA